jgi:hypothetical protein
LAGLVGAAVFLPVFLVWDHAHGWAAIGYHLKSRHHWSFESVLLRDYTLGHLGAVTPVLLIAVAWALVRWAVLWRRGDARGAWLVCFSLFPIVFFLVPSIGTQSLMLRVHWDAVGYASALVALGCLLGGDDLPGAIAARWRRVTAAGLVLAGCMMAAALVVSLLPCLGLRLGMRRPPMHRLMGWREVAAAVREREAAWQGPDRFLVTESFRAALCLGFHLNRREGIYCLPHPRNSHYGLGAALRQWGVDWQSMLEEQVGRPALYVGQLYWLRENWERPPPAYLPAFFPVMAREDSVRILRGHTQVGWAGLYYCEALQPSEGVLEWAAELAATGPRR